jgi:hypothetical protein
LKPLAALGLVLLVLGVVSLFVPIPKREHHAVEAGPIRIGVETNEREKVHPAVSAVLVAGGVALLVADSRKRKRT